MSLGLHNLQSVKKKRKKRVGRGNASGRGTYSTRGMKGQRARAGGRRDAKARNPLVQKLPKLKGFTSQKLKKEIVNLGELNRKFKSGDFVNVQILLKAGLIDNIKAGVKILGNGELKLKNLKVEGCKVSKTAKEKIEKMGGEIKVKSQKSKVKSTSQK